MIPNPAMFKELRDWAQALHAALTRPRSAEHKQLPMYGAADLPTAEAEGLLIYVPDETGGATVAFSDGTNWRRVQDRAIVS